MKPSTSSRRVLVVCFTLLALAALVSVPRITGNKGNNTQTESPTPRPQDDTSAHANPRNAARKLARHAARPATDTDAPFTIGDQLYRVALDEAMLRDADGKETLVRLAPPATAATLPARLREFPTTALPVAYPADGDRDPALRRVITSDLKIALDGVDPHQLAASMGLAVKDLPAYAPGWAVMSAADPFAAIAAMEKLRADTDVAAADVLLAVQHTLRAMPNDTLIGDQWHLKNTNSTRTHANVESAWNYGGTGGVKGSGIRIGIVDDGLQTAHPDLAANVDTANDKDWNGNDADPNPGTDDDHGTSCAGNAAARGNNSLGVAGTAPEATLVGMRLIAASVTDAQEAEALAYRNDIIQVKSNSWGPNDSGNLLEGPGSLTRAALNDAVTNGRGGRGTIFLWAGGNGGDVDDNSNYDGYANAIETIAIGASDSSGARSYYSEPGANLVVVAPSSSASVGITTVDRTGTNGYNTATTANGGDYTNDFGGTSSATPTAAGVVALMLEKNPNLGWRDVQEILIHTAYKIRPTDSDWATNSATFSFNHDFGAGLIDATAAVNLAATWTNLAAQTSTTSAQTGLSVTIPDNNATGITRSFDLSSTNIRAEHVTLTLSATHTARGNLEVTLTSPGGMASRLTEVHSDTGNNYSSWTFSSVRHWGELSTGTWTLKIADRSTSGNSTGGTLTAATLKIFGTAATPVNTPPSVQITNPADAQLYSPGATVNISVSASDLDANGDPGTVTSVELFADGVSLGTDSTAPYEFTWSPANGSHTLYAQATDDEAATGTSPTISIEVANQPPAITAAPLDATGQQFSDTPLVVTSVAASDPENATLTYTYQWQSSTDGVTFTNDATQTTATLSASPSHAAQLWQCVVTASDGEVSSSPFTTAAVNILHRPVTTAALGDSYSHQSGLVLRGTESNLTRPAIINEFSQGPVGSSSEWIEILTLQDTSLAYWDLQDAAGNLLVFLDDPVWDDIPAGTLIVIYNGASKDPLLPADDTDPSDGRMVLSSTDSAYFDSSYDSWLPLGNSGDSIFLSDADSNTVHSLAYGNSTATTPNIGAVGSGKSAYYASDTDEGADLAANWVVTTSLTARRVTRATGDLFISEYVEGTSNNKALELYNPSTTTVDFATTPYTIEIYANGNSSPNSTITLSSIGSVAPGGTYVIKHTSASGSIAAQETNGDVSFNGDDAVVLKKSGTIVDSIGQVGFDPGVEWSSNGVTTLNMTLVRKPAISTGDTTTTDAYDPSIEWTATSVDDYSGLGSHTIASSGPTLAISVSPATVAENAGTAASTGTVTISAALASDLTVALTSSDTSSATVPASAVITAGQTTANFSVAAIDDTEIDGTQSVTLTASATGYTDATTTLNVTDDEAPLEGVTPGAANNTANSGFVTALRNGLLNSPALFRLGTGANIPVGLTLDPATGLLSGTIDASNPLGDYPIIIERTNTLGEVVTESYTLTLSGPTGGDYAAWIAGYNTAGLSGPDADADHDGIPNAIENILGTSPVAATQGLNMVSGSTGTLVFQHTLSNTPASDVSSHYEWSTDLENWHLSGETTAEGTATISAALLNDLAAPDLDLVEVTCTAPGIPRLFVRLVSVKQ